ncbi:glycosyltransferase [Sulfurospirillum diekertiae]|uniref:Glycosyltransferase n=1 Tax=Sulfurospirillum diekertiae TaxID=1854492 RepID=A0A6G9VRB4_9BACT|nr:glycosyltransferase [Sulfurospirillum diekertiae]QIR75406.1 glycosyltransferase [Sulfurospirillum diekertiae]QIR78057.1 glycosyltransferase [Sulfurospirillum diekertiae]
MKVSAFTFIKNGEILGYPFVESIKSILPIVDEFVVNVGQSEDDTLKIIQAIDSPKIRIIESLWNNNMKDRGYVYGQQKMIAQFNCTGDWAFYLEGDEVVHEEDLDKIYACMEKYKDDANVEAIVFDYYHFYGNANSYLWSPAWYRKAPRIIKNSIRSYAPDGLFWLVLDQNKIGRYPKAVECGAKMYHYGWVRSEAQMNLKSEKVQQYWNKGHKTINYADIDGSIVQEFKGTHPKIVQEWLPKEKGVFQADKHHVLTKKEKKHRIMLTLENLFGLELSKKHYKRIK